MLTLANKKVKNALYEEAITLYETLINKNPEIYKNIIFNIDYCNYKLGRNKELIKNYELYINKNEEQELISFGTALLGPIFLNFFRELEKVDWHGIKKLYFFGREGFFLTRAYEKILKNKNKNLPEAVYLNISRCFLFKLCLDKPEFIEDTLSIPYKGNIEDFLYSRYGLNYQELEKIITQFKLEELKFVELPRDKVKIKNIFNKIKPIIKEIVSKKYKAYQEYLQSIGFFEQEITHCVDIGFSGTTQKTLSKLFNSKIHGHYFYTTNNAQDTEYNKFQGYILNKVNQCNVLISRSSYAEVLLTAPVGTLIDIEKNAEVINFKYGKKMRTQIMFDLIEKMVEGAINYGIENYQYKDIMDTEDLSSFYERLVNSKNSFSKKSKIIMEMDSSINGINRLRPVDFFLG